MAVRTSAQARQSLIDSLDTLGASKAQYDTADVFSVAEQDVANFIERVKTNIQAANMVLTGGIEDIKVRATPDSLQIVGNEYLLYQDKGVKGSISGTKAPNSPYKYTDKMPPLQVFIDYIKRKNVNLKNEAMFFKAGSAFENLTEEEQIRTVAFLMQRAVFEYGFKPRNIFSKELPQLKEDLKKSIKGFAADSIKEVFRQKV
jgi:hypothetical protein